jgi:alpha-glucosidase
MRSRKERRRKADACCRYLKSIIHKCFTMTRIFLFVILFVSITGYSNARDYKINSPDRKTGITVSTGSEIKWSASFEGKEIFSSSKIALVLAGGQVLGENEKVERTSINQIQEIITPIVPYKRSQIPNNCNILTLYFKSGFAIEFRAYNDGVAYRFETFFKDQIIVKNEISDLVFPPGSHSWYPREESFMSHNERLFIYSSLDTIVEKHLASLPTLFQVNGINVLITESDIEDYPGMWIRGGGAGKITGQWPHYPKSEKLDKDRNLYVTAAEDYIAKTSGARLFPWRVFIISATDAGLVENDLVYRLAPPNQIADTKWIKPGHVAWDWWNANNIYGVDFRAGINNDTYKYYIDFAAKNGIEYIILDEGWYKLGNVLEQAPGIDVQALCRYAADRNVGVILWVVWKSFLDKMDEALTLYEKWGVKGVKVDFMQRDDQKVVDFYLEAMRKTAEHHMLIDFHGAYKPDGMGRTWPNAITREGVKGMENDKWSRDISPGHDVTLPFTRMVAGPMDYTPGALMNMDSVNFVPKFTRPESQGTRAHQVALYVVYESPLQMLSDSPSNYTKEQETTTYIVNIPVVWDDIKVLEAKVGDYLLLARRSGKEWFIGALTDWTSRDMNLDLSFLPGGQYTMDIFQDGINADRYATDYKHYKVSIKSGEKMKIHLAPGGGWAARIVPM